MADYIDRSKLEFVFRQCNRTDSNWTPQRVVQMIHRQPTDDVSPVVYGRWEVYLGGKELMCSSCKTTFWDEEQVGGSNYCPNCGAKMDGGSKDNGC